MEQFKRMISDRGETNEVCPALALVDSLEEFPGNSRRRGAKAEHQGHLELIR